jgi:type II secretory pathway component GspD/PulD (secretin)
MKSKATLLSLIGLIVTSAAFAQQPADTNQPPTAGVPTEGTSTATNVSASPTGTASATAPADAGATAAPAAAGAPASTDSTAAAPAPQPVAISPAPTVAVTPAATSEKRDPNSVIPLIVMDEVPLTDAIKNLARQAGLNYMLDPKITYGAPGADGKVTPQPLVSLRWENLTADQALNAVLGNYNLTIVDDPKTKIARITVKDPAAPDPLVTKVIQLKYANPTNIVVNVSGILQDKRSRAAADVRTSQLVVVATDKELVAVDDLINKLDTATKEVLIEARLVETSKNPSTTKGVDWTGTFAQQHVRFGNNTILAAPFQRGQQATPGTVTTTAGGTIVTGGSPGTPDLPAVPSTILDPAAPMLTANTAQGFFPQTFFLNADGASAVLSFLNTDTDAQVLSTPRAVTLDNETANLSVTRAVPIFKTTAGTQGSPGGAEVTYTNLGTILRVTPRISANKMINLKVVPEVSSVAGTVTKTVSGTINQADIYDVRHIDTQVLIPSGNTLVMGGLVSDDRNKGYIKVPVLGDIPFLGALFRQESKSQVKKNLLIFVTPTIVENEDYQPTQTDFLKNKLPDENTSDFGAWDSGKPQDWSKLFGKKSKDANSDPDFK